MNEIDNEFKLQGNFLSTEDLRDLFTFYEDVRYVVPEVEIIVIWITKMTYVGAAT